MNDTTKPAAGLHYMHAEGSGPYELIGVATGAGPSKVEPVRVIYRRISDGKLFYRYAWDFVDRMNGVPASKASAVPKDWKLVPIEPTPRMLDAGGFYHIYGPNPVGKVELSLAKSTWKAMLAAVSQSEVGNSTLSQTPELAQPSIADDPEFRSMFLTCGGTLIWTEEAFRPKAAYIDAKVTLARLEGIRYANTLGQFLSNSDSAEIKEWKTRCFAAEEKLASIRAALDKE